jgi:uncharacterized lipoprotein YajG
MRKTLVTAAALVLLAGCAAGPDYRKPDTPEPEAFRAVHQDGDFEQAVRDLVAESNDLIKPPEGEH